MPPLLYFLSQFDRVLAKLHVQEARKLFPPLHNAPPWNYMGIGPPLLRSSHGQVLVGAFFGEQIKSHFPSASMISIHSMGGKMKMGYIN